MRLYYFCLRLLYNCLVLYPKEMCLHSKLVLRLFLCFRYKILYIEANNDSITFVSIYTHQHVPMGKQNDFKIRSKR